MRRFGLTTDNFTADDAEHAEHAETAAHSTRGNCNGATRPAHARVLKAFFNTYNALGAGFLESVYKRGLMVELRHLGGGIASEVRIPIFHRGEKIGEYSADIIVDDAVIVECKVAERIVPAHRAQVINYLKATRYEVGLLLNYGPSPSFERIVCSNSSKTGRPL